MSDWFWRKMADSFGCYFTFCFAVGIVVTAILMAVIIR